jgi:hypothetical protein
LALARTLPEFKAVRDEAEALRQYARKRGESLEVQNAAAVVTILASQRAGALLVEMARAQGKKRPDEKGMRGFRVMLTRNGIAEPSARRWQAMAQVPIAVVERLAKERTHAGKELTSAEVYAIARGAPHVAQNAGENEWYTPPKLIEAARVVLGDIELDPASHKDAQSVIKARRYYTAETDGLAKPWSGCVWLNPPYSQPLVQQFSEKLVAEYNAGRVLAAVTLTNNATETSWAQSLLTAAAAICFPRGRVVFWAPGRSAAPLQGQMLCYLGSDPGLFAAHFRLFGVVFGG